MNPSWIPDPEREAPRDEREARRLERMEETWKLLAPSDLEVAATRRQALPRALVRKARRPRPLLWSLAAALAAGAVFAAGGVLVWKPEAAEPAVTNAAPTPSVAISAPRSVGKGTHAEVAATESESEAIEREATALLPSSDSGTSRPAPEPTRVAPSGAASSANDGWNAVATALREDDPARAREVLDELTKRQDPATRDAAALARAQLDWSQGEHERARRELERLAAAGATKEIRAQAARSIARFEER